jgi:hypothetical protein
MTRMPYFRMMSGPTSWRTKLTHSGWLIHNEPSLKVAVVGGGVIGDTAQQQARAGADVILLTESVLTSGASAFAAVVELSWYMEGPLPSPGRPPPAPLR